MTHPRTSKAKGRLGQQEIRDAILEAFPELEPDDVRSTAMGQSGEDLQLSPKARALLGITSEIKRTKASQKTLYNWYGQATEHGKTTKGTPVVFHRSDRRPWLVTLGLSDFLGLLARKGK